MDLPVCRHENTRPAKAKKPRMSFTGMAAKKSRCQQAKAAGLPCTEFAAVVVPQPPRLSEMPRDG
jgi:hypothetical protein